MYDLQGDDGAYFRACASLPFWRVNGLAPDAAPAGAAAAGDGAAAAATMGEAAGEGAAAAALG